MNPTVSISNMVCPSGSTIPLDTGSRVANSLSSTNTSLPLREFIKVLFPALVYPANAQIGYPSLSRFLRRAPLRSFTLPSSVSISFILRWICLRSLSNFFSPGPLVPIPAPSLESAIPIPINRGKRYFN